MGQISIPVSVYAGLHMESLLYGVNSVVYPLSLIILTSRGRWSTPGYRNNRMVFVTTLLYVLVTIHYWLEFTSSYLANFENYYPRSPSPENKASDKIAALINFIGELVLIHRLYVLWGMKRYIAIPPTIAAVVALVSTYVSLQFGENLTTPRSVVTGTIAFSLCAAVDLIVTCLIVGRIWWMSRDVKKTLQGAKIVPAGNFRSIRVAMEVSIESGFLITAMNIVLLAFYKLDHTALPLGYYLGAQIYAFAPMLVILRVGLYRSSAAASTFQPNVLSAIRFNNSETDEEGSQPQTPTHIWASQSEDKGGVTKVFVESV